MPLGQVPRSNDSTDLFLLSAIGPKPNRSIFASPHTDRIAPVKRVHRSKHQYQFTDYLNAVTQATELVRFGLYSLRRFSFLPPFVNNTEKRYDSARSTLAEESSTYFWERVRYPKVHNNLKQPGLLIGRRTVRSISMFKIRSSLGNSKFTGRKKNSTH